MIRRLLSRLRTPTSTPGRRYSYHPLVAALGVPLALLAGLLLPPKVSAVLAIAMGLYLYFTEAAK